MNTFFTLSNAFVMPFWLLMILAPRWSLTTRLMRSPVSVIALPLVYTALIVPMSSTLVPLLTPPTLAGIMGVVATPAGTMVVWLHILSLDLFVGRWIYLDSQERGFPAWWISPVLLLTLAFGPFGLSSYLVMRALRPARPTAAESAGR